MPRAAVNGTEIHYETRGEGDPVLLLIGLSGIGRGWAEQIPLFGREHLVVFPDHRGTGRSARPEEGYTIETHAADMAGLLRSLGCGPAHVVGSSAGGAIAQVMALDHPDVVRTLTLASSWARPDAFFRHQFQMRRSILMEMGVRAYVEASAIFVFSPRFFRDFPERVREWCEAAVAASPDSVIAARRIEMLLAHDRLKNLPAVRQPTLVIVGSDDLCTPPHLSEELATAIPGSELTVMEGGHLVHREHPEAFHALVEGFLPGH
jgi:aminoacrylate hydrolase